jgi:hypothetical protein
MKLSEKIEGGKRQIANYLNELNEKFSQPTRKKIFVIVGIIMGCICLAMIIEPFRNPIGDRDVILRDGNVPVVIAPPDAEPLISSEEFSMLTDFKKMIDSLRVYDHKSFREILSGRDGLMDSIDFLIKLY